MKISLFVITFLISLSSCDNYLNLQPTDGLVSDDYWKNKEEVLSVLGAAYEKFADLDHTLFVHGEVRGDLIINDNAPSSQRKMMESNIEPNNGFAKWSGFYSVINLCNHVITLAPAVQDKDATFTDYQKDQYIAEATFIRSLCYFYLVRIFNDVPYVTDPTRSDNAEFFEKQTSADDILVALTADLKAIRTPKEYPTVEETKCRATAAAVNSLLADISLWNEDYDACISYIEAVEASGKYFLKPALRWFENYSPGLSLENIFEIYFDAANNQSNSLFTNTYTRDYYQISPYAYEILNVDETLANEIVRGSGTYFHNVTLKIAKYAKVTSYSNTTRSGSEQASANFIIYRLADLYLMKAEAYSQKENPEYEKALEYINIIRERSNMLPISPSFGAVPFEDAILEERAKELAFEGKRWFDLLRMGRRNDFSRKDKLIEVLVQNVPSSQRLVQAAKLSNSLGWYMPIHIDEITRNENLTQNPYYDDEK